MQDRLFEPPSDAELDKIEGLTAQFSPPQAVEKVLGKARADAYQNQGESVTEPSVAQQPEVAKGQQPVKIDRVKIARLGLEAVNSGVGVEEFLKDQPPSPERDQLLNAFKEDSDQAA